MGKWKTIYRNASPRNEMEEKEYQALKKRMFAGALNPKGVVWRDSKGDSNNASKMFHKIKKD